MASILAIVSKAIFEKQARIAARLAAPGDLWATARYESTHASLEPLAAGGALYLVTVRPGDALWLVAILKAPQKREGGWQSAPNATPITDITALIPKLVFATGKGLTAAPGKLGMSLQTPRGLTPADEALLRGGAPADGTLPRGDAQATPRPDGRERALGFVRSQFERHVADRAPHRIDLGLCAALVADAEGLQATACAEEYARVLAAASRAQAIRAPTSGAEAPDTASEKVSWGALAHQQYAVHTAALGRAKRPFVAVRPATYERVIRRLGEIRTAMLAKVQRPEEDADVGIVTRRLASYEAELRDLREARSALGAPELAAALGEALDDVERDWRALDALHPSLVEPASASAVIDRVDDIRRELEPLGASAAWERAGDLEDAWIAWHARVKAAQLVAPDFALPSPSTRRIRLVPHASVDRIRALATLAAAPKTRREDEDEDEEDEGEREPPPVRMKRGGELVLAPAAIMVFATLGVRSARSHFAERHLFRWLAWVDNTWDYHQDLRSEMGREDGGRPLHLFARIAGDRSYFYAGVATVVASRDRTARPGVWIDLALGQPIPLEAWRRFGGAFRIVTLHGREHAFADDPARSERWIGAAGPHHYELVSEDGSKLTMHGTGPRVELEYRASHDAEPLFGIDESVAPDAPAVDVVCSCGRTRELRALDTLARADAVAALKTFMTTNERPQVLKPRPPLPPTDNEWLRRYRAGEHVAVWNEIRALGTAVEQGPAREAARDVLREMMLRVRGNIDLIAVRLRAFRYVFEDPSHTRVPLTDSERAILARNDDPPFLPLSLRVFLDVVGCVNLVQNESQHSFEDVHTHAGTLGGLGQEGPLEMEAILTKEGANVTRTPQSWALFREDCLKAGCSGDYHYFELPNPAADFFIRSGDSDHEYFIDYLRATLDNGGFRGHLGCEEEHADDKGHGAVPRAFRYFLARDLEPF